MEVLSNQQDWQSIFLTPPMSIACLSREGQNKTYTSSMWGESFSELKPYSDGHPLKNLDWRRYLNHGEMVIKNYDLPQRTTLWILLDGTESMLTGRQALWARDFALRVATAIIKGGQLVRFLIDSQEDLHFGQVLSSLHHLKTFWETTVMNPAGSSAHLTTRKNILRKIPSSDSLLCLSDGLVSIREVVTNGEFLSSKPMNRKNHLWRKWLKISNDENKKSIHYHEERLISIKEQLPFTLGRLRHVFYLCVIDREADIPPQNILLHSPESPRKKKERQRGPIKEADRKGVIEKLEQYRNEQAMILRKFQHCQWYNVLVTQDPKDILKGLAQQFKI